MPIVGLLLVSCLGTSGTSEPTVGVRASGLSEEGGGGSLYSEGLSVSPEPDAWTNTVRTTIRVTILDPSFAPDLTISRVLLDGARLVPEWNPENRTLWMAARDPQADGPHVVDVRLEDLEARALTARWTFHQDSVSPVVTLDRLPEVAGPRVFPINGTVVEQNLERVQVNGFTALIEQDRFFVPTLLWPGTNDVLVTAVDRAANRGLAKGGISWFPEAPTEVTYETFVHPNASFTVRLPTSWSVRLDHQLEDGYRADVTAVDPDAIMALSSLAIVSRAAGAGMNEGLLLGVMSDTIERMGGQGLFIVSQTRLIPAGGNVIAAQFSVVETLPGGVEVFRIVTGIWSRSVNRLWLIIGSAGTQDLERSWHALQTATETFRAIDPERPPSSGESPQAGIDRALIVTTAGLVSIVSVFAATLYSIRRRRPQD